MAITQTWQAELRGLLQGAGTAYGLTAVDGLGSPPLRTDDVDRPRRDGARGQDDYYASRTIVLGFIIEDTPAGIDGTVDVWKQAWRRVTDVDIALDLSTESTTARRYFGRPRRLSVDEGAATWHFGRVVARAEFVAMDPRGYSLAEQSVELSVPVFTGGLTFDLTFDMTFGTGSSGSQIVSNGGNVDTYPTLTLNGPLVQPSVENVTTGETFSFDDTIADGDFVTVDLQERTVLLNGTASRKGKAVGSDWWALALGDSDLSLQASSGAGTCDVTWRDAYL